MKRPNWKIIGALILILVLFGYIVFAIISFSNKNGEKPCESVVISIKDSADIQFVSEQDIRTKLKEKDFKLQGKQLQKIKTQEIERVLEENPFIRNVECYKTPSGDLNIDVWQREPIFRVYGLASYYVDINGRIFPISPDYVAYVPVVTGSVKKQFAMKDLREFVVYLRNNAFWNAQIEQIDIQPNNEIVLIPRVGSHEIEIGSLEDYPAKLAKLKAFYMDGLNKIGWGDYKSISLKFKNQVVCTKK